KSSRPASLRNYFGNTANATIPQRLCGASGLRTPLAIQAHFNIIYLRKKTPRHWRPLNDIGIAVVTNAMGRLAFSSIARVDTLSLRGNNNNPGDACIGFSFRKTFYAGAGQRDDSARAQAVCRGARAA